MELRQFDSTDYRVPVIGQGTWYIDASVHALAAAVLRRGLDLGMNHIDTAEMYGDAEEIVGEAIAGRRDEVFLVGKVMPHHATEEGTVAACEASLRRLGTDRFDLYLLHWRGRVPLHRTLRGFERLLGAGRIRHWGVGNFSVADLAELVRLPGGEAVATDQVLYNLAHRTMEYDVLPWCLERGLPVMAYSPLEQGHLLGHPALDAVAARHAATPAQVAIAWVAAQGKEIVPLVGARTRNRLTEALGATKVTLTQAHLAALAKAFPPDVAAGTRYAAEQMAHLDSEKPATA
jgi:diketogulonate reductase-like aldo/keto reductase